MTNVIALLLTISGWALAEPLLLNIGLFALAGAITNTLAIHMLFERVPLFDSQKPQRQTFDFEPVLAEVDLSLAFRALQKAVEQSSLGAMLAMFGGSAVLQPLEQPFTDKLRGALLQIAASDDFQQLLLKQLHNSSQLDALQQQIEQIVQQRLHELTPELVKDIIQRMIRQHLGWLVVWGGVFGGLLGLMAGLLTL
ncbi:MAG: DUF445 domain-containing protein [Alishewanella sp. 32-51-5]|nr:MAG: DUF445 domain-containing protein [Alishewanella sp. 32-51-5]